MDKPRKRTDTIPQYDPAALERNIERCKANIDRMREAINREIGHINYLKKLLAEARKRNGHPLR